jgi:hypothetical protein
MLNLQRHQPIKISHPLVREAYLKREGLTEGTSKDILVLETNFHEDTEAAGFDPYLADLLTDLQKLKDEVEQKCGRISRIDIRKH